MDEKFLITGGAGFIGSAFCRFLINKTNNKAVIVDKFSYGSNKNSLSTIKNSKRVKIYAEDLCEYEAIKKILIKKTLTKLYILQQKPMLIIQLKIQKSFL